MPFFMTHTHIPTHTVNVSVGGAIELQMGIFVPDGLAHFIFVTQNTFTYTEYYTPHDTVNGLMLGSQ